ncbi:ABCB10 [Symbiodinium pilosum]|uniref:ABCB10 protein n=1 Tax=Symbiodinium pilosum TaxID=2952 RepID=A0A812QZL5_SYMPI|nr:ABCB10 [Symbiodinium pilosum]
MTSMLERLASLNPFHSSTPAWARDEDAWALAARKRNRMLAAKLKVKSGDGQSFVAATYHMPCLFDVPIQRQAKAIHAVLLRDALKMRFPEESALVLAGDFNTKPEDSELDLLKTGRLPESDVAWPPPREEGPDFASWQNGASLQLHSAYAAALSSEPEYTNYAWIEGSPTPFRATLDYIFTTSAIEVVQVLPLPQVPSGDPVLPTAEMLGCKALEKFSWVWNDAATELFDKMAKNWKKERAGSLRQMPMSCSSRPRFLDAETEGQLTIDVMRMGSMKGVVKVWYRTVDASGEAGVNYEKAFGELIFGDQEYRKSIDISIIPTPDGWNPLTEFQVKLFDPEDCNLGNYLHTCRVKLIDDDTFPSSKYFEELRRPGGIDEISSVGLFREYWKLCFTFRGIGSRTAVNLIFDQLKNAFRYYMLYLNMYMVDVLFNLQDEEAKHELILPSRVDTAYLVAVAYLLPTLVLHVWDIMRAVMDVEGRLQVLLKSYLFRRYLNYSEESRQSVAPPDMLVALGAGAEAAAKGYAHVMPLCQQVGQLGVFIYFTVSENPGATYLLMAMPSVMAVFLLWKLCMREDPAEPEVSAHSLAAEVCQRYRLVADYSKRSKVNDAFDELTETERADTVPLNVASVNNDYFPAWLGPLFVSAYIVIDAGKVFEGELSLGTFLATVAVMRDVSSEFGRLYHLILELADLMISIRQLTLYINKRTDLRPRKAVNRERRALTKEARNEVMRDATLKHPDGESTAFKTDLIPIKLVDVSYGWDPQKPIFKDVNISVPQGKLVAVMGAHGTGKATLLKLMGGTIFPNKGTVFVPAHLRMLHVTQEAVILNVSPWQNLTFGASNPDEVDPMRVRHICQRLRMKAVLEMIEDDLRRVEDPDAEKQKNLVFINSSWQDSLTYSEKVKICLARALLMNPNLMVLQRPLHHYDDATGDLVLNLLKEHVANRGLELPEDSILQRRPRSCFLTVESAKDAQAADAVWYIEQSSIRALKPEEVTDEFFTRRISRHGRNAVVEHNENNNNISNETC